MTQVSIETQLDDTLSALQGDVTALDSASAIDLLEGWQAALTRADLDGADDISSMLVQLQSQLEQEEPDARLISELLSDLSNAVQDVADAASEDQAGKLQLLADVLGEAGENVEG